MYESTLTAEAEVADGRVTLTSPAVGLWREAPAPGTLIRPGVSIGRLEVLGTLYRLIAPERAFGIVVAPDGEAADERGVTPPQRARQPVDYGAALVLLDPEAVSAGEAAVAASDAAHSADGLVFRASTSGRFYGRPAPDRDAFISADDTIEVGQTVCLLEVMKTFHRVSYGGPGLPERARVLEIVPKDEQDLAAGDVILILEPA